MSDVIQPTERLLSLMSKNLKLQHLVKRIQKEFEIFEYFSNYSPQKIEENKLSFTNGNNTGSNKERKKKTINHRYDQPTEFAFGFRSNGIRTDFLIDIYTPKTDEDG